MLSCGVIISALLSVSPCIQADTLKSSEISSERFEGNISMPQTALKEDIARSGDVADAIRRFSGLQLRDYGGAGGLRTVNVRSLGSAHTGVFIDGIQVMNAQNMQVDLGRFSTDILSEISLYNGLKTDFLQSASEYAAGSSLYLWHGAPDFGEGGVSGTATLKGSTLAGGEVSAHSSFKAGRTSYISAGAGFLRSEGMYRFKPAGYDTTMVRRNGDITSGRMEIIAGSMPGTVSEWYISAYGYESERGLPGPVYKRAEEWQMSSDRQKDMNLYVQGRWKRPVGKRFSIMVSGKAWRDRLRYTDISEISAVDTAVYKYNNSGIYSSAAVLYTPVSWLKLAAAADYRYSRLIANRLQTSPKRHESLESLSASFVFGSFDASISTVATRMRDIFGEGEAVRSAITPSAVLLFRPCREAAVGVFAKESFRMPTFNDIYYVTAGVKSLRPERARQVGINTVYKPFSSGPWDAEAAAEGYYNYVTDKIIAVPTANQFRWTMYNIGRVRIIGADLRASVSYSSEGMASGCCVRYSFQRARDVSAAGKKQIPYIPLHSGSGELFFEFKGWRADLSAQLTGERFTVSSNLPQFRLGSWFTMDLRLAKELKTRLTWAKGITLSLDIRNLTGENYEIVSGYPMPGCNASFSVKAGF